MYKLILKDIKSLYTRMLIICIQMVVIFSVFFPYFTQYRMYIPSYTRLKVLEDANVTVLDTFFQPVGDIATFYNRTNLFEQEADYLGNIIDNKKGFTYAQTQPIYGGYNNLVIVGDIKSVLYNTDDEFVSGIYLGSDVKTDALKVGGKLNVNANDIPIFEQLPKNTYFETHNTKLLLDDFTVLSLTWDEFFDAYGSTYDRNCISNFVLTNCSESEIAEFVNKFSEYPDFIIRERTKPIPYIYENLIKQGKLYTTMSMIMFIISSYTMMILFGKKCTIMNEDDGKLLYIRITTIIAITFLLAFLIAYLFSFNNIGITFNAIIGYFISVFVTSLVEGYILFSKVKRAKKHNLL